MLVLKNIRHHRFRFILTGIIVCLISFSFITCHMLVETVTRGTQTAKNRIAADLIVIPSGQDLDPESILYEDAIVSMYMDRSAEETIRGVAHVTGVSSRMYLATLDGASCCDGRISLIATDLEDDFMLNSWTNTKTLGAEEIILGHNFLVTPGDEVQYFGRRFRVVEVLEKTGTSFDNSGFISFGAAQEIQRDERYREMFPEGDVTSMILINSDNPKVTQSILFSQYGKEFTVYMTNTRFVTYAHQVRMLTSVVWIFNGILLCIGAFGVFGMTAISTQTRRNEFGSMQLIGYRKGQIAGLFFVEQVLVFTIASILSLGLFLLFLQFGAAWVSDILGCPMSDCSLVDVVRWFGIVYGCNILLAFMSVGLSIWNLCVVPPAKLMKESL